MTSRRHRFALAIRFGAALASVTAGQRGHATPTPTVAAPIEEKLSAIEGLLYFSSSADSSGKLTITITFEIGTDIDRATFNVSNEINSAVARLPPSDKPLKFSGFKDGVCGDAQHHQPAADP